jgi:hypothetical protein
MLPGMYQAKINAYSGCLLFLQGMNQGSDFHEVGPSTGNKGKKGHSGVGCNGKSKRLSPIF